MNDKTYARVWAVLQADVDERIAEAIKSKEEMDRYAKSAFERAMRDKDDALALSDEIYAKNMTAELNGMTKALMWVRDRMEEIKEEKENCDD
jgi:shikimate kinase